MQAMADTPHLLASYYGDDLTGSTDVMEALELGGIPTVLFTTSPSEPLLSRFSDRRAIGLAGTSRSQTPDWMEENLTPALLWLKGLNAAICHYKVCSTFDSSPAIGNIGRAVEIGRNVFGQKSVPVIVGAPQLKRFTAFGNLFAGYRGETFRIDRHPVMSRHPVTPMDEADLLRHLARQTALKSGLVDVAQLTSAARSAVVDQVRAEAEMFLLDVDSPQTQKLAGSELWRIREPGGYFVAGSSGVEYALLSAWAELGLAPGNTRFEPVGAVDRIAVISGSVSPTTERQIRMAVTHGFEGIVLDPLALAADNAGAAVAQAVDRGEAALAKGRSVVLYTALGPAADQGARIDRQPGARHRLSRNLGVILKNLAERQKLKRVVIAGGDTSSHALSELGVEALTIRVPLPQTPGSPLCIAHGTAAHVDGIEIALKGGQIGADDYFCAMRSGQLNAGESVVAKM